MTTNDATPREAIAIEISEVAKADSDLHYATSGSMFLDNPEECADAVIAHLWQAADDAAVVAAVRDSFYADRIIPADMDVKRRQTEYAVQTIQKVLTALIGPRPQENDDGQ